MGTDIVIEFEHEVGIDIGDEVQLEVSLELEIESVLL